MLSPFSHPYFPPHFPFASPVAFCAWRLPFLKYEMSFTRVACVRVRICFHPARWRRNLM